MTIKVVRGQVIVFEAHPHDHAGNPVTPANMKLYLNYVHPGNTQGKNDPPIDMEMQTDGVTWLASFDTAAAEEGAAFASIRATAPGGAEDFKFSITANIANPDPT
jgi:hypothetical protein